MPKRGDREFLSDIKEASERIIGYVSEMSYDDFLEDYKTQDAVLRNLEVMGEAIKNISKGLRKNHGEVEWKEIAGMRDRVIHQYFGIQWEIVWSAIKDKVPELRGKIETILKLMPGDPG